MYLTGFWAAIGPIANWQIAGSQLMATVVTWMMVLIFLHLHLIVPSQIFKKRLRLIVFAIYLITIPCAVLSLFQLLPTSMTTLALVVAILISIALLIFRSVAPTSAESDRMATRLMLAGIDEAALLHIFAAPHFIAQAQNVFSPNLGRPRPETDRPLPHPQTGHL